MKNLLAAVLVISVTSIALSQNAKPPVPEPVPPVLPVLVDPFAPLDGVVPNKTQRWEYKVSDRGGFEPGDWQKKLNDLAAEGWELDAIDEGHYILRRPVQHPLRVFGAP